MFQIHFARLLLLGAALMITGCFEKSAQSPKSTELAHPSEGLHGGPLVEWGREEYHPEMLIDRKAKKVTVYIHDGSARKITAIKAEFLTMKITNVKTPVTLKLLPEREMNDPADASSRFSVVDEVFSENTALEGKLMADFNGKHYDGRFTYK
jgi:hypothetical protein